MLRRLRNLIAVAVIAAAPALTVLMPGVAHAAGTTLYYCGFGNNTFNIMINWNTAADCTSGTAQLPTNGDNVIFDITTLSSDTTVNNDMVGLSLADITFTGSSSNSLTISSNALTLTGNLTDDTGGFNAIDNDIAVTGTTTVTLSNGSWLTLNGTISGSGSIILAATSPEELDLLGDVTMTGSITVNGGILLMIAQSSADATVSGVTVASGATFAYDAFGASGVTTYTLSTPINSAGGTLDFGTTGAGPNALNLTGTITLTGDTDILTTAGTVVHVKGSLHGPTFKLTTANSGQVLNESTDNTSATPAGDINPAAVAAPAAAPGTPDTGFALVSANPIASLAVTVLAAGSILAISRLTRNATSRR
jgi:hypothetical protein